MEKQQKISCRIFKEQLDLVNNLPENDRANVLYLAINNAFKNQDGYQNENQVDNQDANQSYLYQYHLSVYKSLSELGKSVLNIFNKTIEAKDFTNWGGNRKGSGRPKSNGNQLDTNSIPNGIQRKDKDKDKDKDKSKDKDKYDSDFELFWNSYKPVECNGRFVDKGSKRLAFSAWKKAITLDTAENILNGLNKYLDRCSKNNILTCGASVFLNQERWKIEDTQVIVSENKKSEVVESTFDRNIRITQEMLMGLDND